MTISLITNIITDKFQENLLCKMILNKNQRLLKVILMKRQKKKLLYNIYVS